MCNLFDNNFITKYYIQFMHVLYNKIIVEATPYLLCNFMVFKLAQKLFDTV